MTYTEILRKIKSEEYKNKKPYPSSDLKVAESVKNVMKRNFREEDIRLLTLFRQDIRKYVEDELGSIISDRAFNAIYSKAWDDCHYGLQDVLFAMNELIEVVKPFRCQTCTES